MCVCSCVVCVCVLFLLYLSVLIARTSPHTEMVHFVQNMGNLEAEKPVWINWRNNPHARALRNAVLADRVNLVSDTDSTTEEEDYVPLMHQQVNSGSRMCRCGSRTHVATNHHQCPLNQANKDVPTAKRLALYIPCRMWRWYNFGEKVSG